MALLVNPTDAAKGEATDVQAAARRLGVELHVVAASTERDFAAVFASPAQLRAGGLVIGSGAFFVARQEQLAALAVRHAAPAVFENRRVRRRRRSRELWRQPYRRLPSGGSLYRAYSQRR